MASDYDLAMVTARCSRCSRVVSASFGDLRETGVFACVCGNMTRARHRSPAQDAAFSHAHWRNARDGDRRIGWG